MDFILELAAAWVTGAMMLGLTIGAITRLKRRAVGDVPETAPLRADDIRHEHATIAQISEEGALRIYECACHGARMWRRILPGGGEERC